MALPRQVFRNNVCGNRSFAMLRPSLFIAALIISLGPVAAEDGCEKFAWSVARERAAFAASDKTTALASDTLTALPPGALVIRLQQGGQAAFDMPPERKPRTEPWHGGMVRLPALAKPGIYQITLSDDAWIDVIQNGRYARSVGSTGRSDCPGVRKSVRLDLDASPIVLQVSGVAAETIVIAIGPVQ
jgi:hypothetical protein